MGKALDKTRPIAYDSGRIGPYGSERHMDPPRSEMDALVHFAHYVGP